MPAARIIVVPWRIFEATANSSDVPTTSTTTTLANLTTLQLFPSAAWMISHCFLQMGWEARLCVLLGTALARSEGSTAGIQDQTCVGHLRCDSPVSWARSASFFAYHLTSMVARSICTCLPRSSFQTMMKDYHRDINAELQMEMQNFLVRDVKPSCIRRI